MLLLNNDVVLNNILRLCTVNTARFPVGEFLGFLTLETMQLCFRNG